MKFPYKRDSHSEELKWDTGYPNIFVGKIFAVYTV